MPEQTREDDERPLWARRFMRRPGSLVERNDFVPQPWHLQNPRLGSSGTYCGVNVVRFYSEQVRVPAGSRPVGAVCAKCLRQHELGKVQPQGRGPRRISTSPESRAT